MALRWATLFALVFAFAAGSTFAQVPDSVKLANENVPEESGVIAWGNPGSLHAIGVSPVPIGALSRGEANQAVAFTIDRPPALDSDVAWSGSNDIVPLVYPPLYEIPIRVWIVCADDPCTSPVPAATLTDLNKFLVWANERFHYEHVGIKLIGDAEWISDQTGMTGSVPDLLRDFDTADCGKLAAATTAMKKDGAFNIYMVRTVDTLYRKGDYCYTHDSAVVGSMALKGTILHEMGHDLSLGHMSAKTNLMCADSTKRKFLTEGQVFRMHFSSASGLNFELSSSLPPNPPANRTPRDCDTNTPVQLPCPAEDMRLWKDK
jgi:hypothetical protein